MGFDTVCGLGFRVEGLGGLVLFFWVLSCSGCSGAGGQAASD